MAQLKSLSDKYSTTKLCYKFLDDKYLDRNGKIKKELKFKINNQNLKIKDSKIIGNPKDKFQTSLFLPEGEGRQGEGGLRTRGFLKFSYRKLVKEGKSFKESKDGEWYSVDWNGKPLFKVKFPDEISKKLEKEGITYLPLITVITVVLNGKKTLEDTIKSVINQTYQNVEYIIIDGGSTDGTVDIIKKYEDAIDYWVSEKDKGIYDAMNKGVKVSLGNWIAFLGSGDVYYKNAIELYISIIKNNPNLDYISSKVELIDKYGKTIRIIGKPWNWNTFKKFMNVAHIGSFHNILLFKTQGLFNDNYKIGADYEFLLRKKENLKATYFSSITAKMNSNGVSNRKIRKALIETMRIKVNSGVRNKTIAIIDLCLAFIKVFIRKFIYKY